MWIINDVSFRIAGITLQFHEAQMQKTKVFWCCTFKVDKTIFDRILRQTPIEIASENQKHSKTTEQNILTLGKRYQDM